MKQANRFTLSFKLFYLIYLGAMGAFIPYINVYLEKSAGLTGSQIGLITAISLVLGVCVIPIWGIVGDKTKKYNALLKLSIIATLIVLYFYYRAAVYPMIVICAVGLEISRLGAMPMADTLATNYCHETGGNYGSIRGMGSLGYMLAGMLVGFLADMFGLDGPLFATYAVLLVLAFSITFGFPKDKTKEEDEENTLQKGSFKELLTNRHFIFILVVTLLTVTVVDSAMTYGGNHLVSTLGGPESSISWMTLMTVLPEVLFLMIAIRVINRVGFKTFYLIAIASMFLRFAVYTFIPNEYAFLAISLVHCLGVACVTVGNLTYIRNSVNPAVLGTAITLLNATLSIGKAAYGYIFGMLYEHANSFAIFGTGLIFIAIAFIIVFTSKCFNQIDKQKGHIS